jgi:hypothetical protein
MYKNSCELVPLIRAQYKIFQVAVTAPHFNNEIRILFGRIQIGSTHCLCYALYCWLVGEGGGGGGFE